MEHLFCLTVSLYQLQVTVVSSINNIIGTVKFDNYIQDTVYEIQPTLIHIN